MGKLDELGDAVRRTIRAYHGTHSPQPLTAFDAKFIDSANGNAQGHGFYFSDDPRVARMYGTPVEVELPVDRSQLADLYSPLRHKGEMLDRFAAAVREAPDNKWKNDAWAEMMRRDGQAQLVYQSLLRAHNVGDGSSRLGRYEAGRRTSDALRRHGVAGGWWDEEFAPGAKNYVIFPGVEDQIRILSQGQ